MHLDSTPRLWACVFAFRSTSRWTQHSPEILVLFLPFPSPLRNITYMEYVSPPSSNQQSMWRYINTRTGGHLSGWCEDKSTFESQKLNLFGIRAESDATPGLSFSSRFGSAPKFLLQSSLALSHGSAATRLLYCFVLIERPLATEMTNCVFKQECFSTTVIITVWIFWTIIWAHWHSDLSLILGQVTDNAVSVHLLRKKSLITVKPDLLDKLDGEYYLMSSVAPGVLY